MVSTVLDFDLHVSVCAAEEWEKNDVREDTRLVLFCHHWTQICVRLSRPWLWPGQRCPSHGLPVHRHGKDRSHLELDVNSWFWLNSSTGFLLQTFSMDFFFLQTSLYKLLSSHFFITTSLYFLQTSFVTLLSTFCRLHATYFFHRHFSAHFFQQSSFYRPFSSDFFPSAVHLERAIKGRAA